MADQISATQTGTQTADGAGQGQQAAQQAAQQNAGIQFTTEQQAHIDALIAERLTRAKGSWETVNAATRAERDGLSAKLADLTKALGKETPEAAKALVAEMTGQLEASNRRAAFYEEAGKPEIGCSNPKVAFALAQADGLFNSRGNVDWAALKTAAPELFRAKVPSGNAGTGTGNPPPKTADMNTFIRRASGH